MPGPDNELARLDALYQYRILDTPPEQAFDDLTVLAAQICEAPIALITLLDADRQWFKSKLGLNLHETSRDLSFCAYTVLKPESIFTIPDLARDERFANHPFVSSYPRIRFYAGAPIVVPGGYALGAIEVLDRTPRDLNAEQLSVLKILGRQAAALLELRKHMMDLAQTTSERKKLEEALCETEERYSNLAARTAQLQESSERARLLSGIIPICSGCKKIRDQHGAWHQVEAYIQERTGARFTHTICQECEQKLYSE